LILRLWFEEGLSLPDIARALGLESKDLFKRMNALLESMRKSLEARGFGRSELAGMMDSWQLRQPDASRKRQA
jgi:hypothetical protein